MAKKKKKKSSGRSVISEGDFSKASDGLNGNRVFVAVGKTINMGNYESIRVEYGQGMTVEDGSTFEQAREACLEEATTALIEMIEMVESGKKF